MENDVSIDEFLVKMGFDSVQSRKPARALLERHGLTHPGKQRMAIAKVPVAEALLLERFVLLCGDTKCVKLGGVQSGVSGRDSVLVSPTACSVCGGSNIRRALLYMGLVLKDKGIVRLLVVGGTKPAHQELKDVLVQDYGITIKFVAGAEGAQAKKTAISNMKWAQLCVIWGSTPLDHKISELYKSDRPAGLIVVDTLTKRGVEALCDEVVKKLAG